ncbi:MAG TPA: hypothetical protein PKA63_10360, partial [Oligoflexia bacterium]|nr:hypothetical protein [Oligoflexia bacterium]HMP49060.1 hypothetical protein [Oligoflexia bacterium]
MEHIVTIDGIDRKVTIPKTHIKCVQNQFRHPDYPERAPVTGDHYRPVDFTHPSVLACPPWAHDPDIRKVDPLDMRLSQKVLNSHSINPRPSE